MANNEFNNIEQFIEGFTRDGPTPENYTYDGIIYGIDFEYKNHLYRITRDSTGDEKKLYKIFNKNKNAYIHFFELKKEKYPNENVYDFNQYIGFYDSINELLDIGKINGIKLRDIIASNETKILSID